MDNICKNLPAAVMCSWVMAATCLVGIHAHAQTSGTGNFLPTGANADAVVFQADYVNTNAAQTNAGGLDLANSKQAIAVGPQGVVWVADTGNKRILGFEGLTSGDKGQDATYVIGQRDMFDTDHRFIPELDFIGAPIGVEVDSEGRLYAYTATKVWVYNDPKDPNPVVSAKLNIVPAIVLTGNTPDTGIVSVREVHVQQPIGTTRIAVIGSTSSGPFANFYPLGMPGSLTELSVDFSGVSNGACDAAKIKDIASVDGTNASATKATLLIACSGFVYAFGPKDLITPNAYVLPSGTIKAPYNLGTSHIRSISVSGSELLVLDKNNRALVFPNVITTVAGFFAATPTATALNDTSTLNPPIKFIGQDNDVKTRKNRGASSNAITPVANGFDTPSAIDTDGSGNIWVVDRGNARVVRYDATAAAVSSANIVLGQSDFTHKISNRLEAFSAMSVNSVAISHASKSLGSVFVADKSGHRVLGFGDVSKWNEFSHAAASIVGQIDFETVVEDYSTVQSNTTNNTTIAPPDASDLSFPNHVAVDPVNGDVYVVDSGHKRIVIHTDFINNKAAASAINVDQIAAGATNNFSTFVYGPMVVAPENNSTTERARLYVSVGGTAVPNRIFMYKIPASFTTPHNGVPDLVFGQDAVATATPINSTTYPNADNRTGTTAADSLSNVGGLAIDTDGTLWVADTGNQRVLGFENPDDADTVAATTADWVVGQKDMATVGTNTGKTNHDFTSPIDVAMGPNGGLWVLDGSRILFFPTPKVLDPAEGMPIASIVLGQKDFTSVVANSGTVVNGTDMPGLPGQNTLSAPTAIATDKSGNTLLVADTGNNRLLRFTNVAPMKITGGGTFEVVAGQQLSVPLKVEGGSSPGSIALVAETPIEGAQMTGSTLTYTAPGDAAGDRVLIGVTVTDEGPRPQSASASVIVNITPNVSPESGLGCRCNGGTSLVVPWLLALIPIWRRRRRKRLRCSE